MVASGLLVAYACLRHWYMGMMFFAPIPLVGLWVYLSGRRHAAEGEPPDDHGPGSHAAGAAG